MDTQQIFDVQSVAAMPHETDLDKLRRVALDQAEMLLNGGHARDAVVLLDAIPKVLESTETKARLYALKGTALGLLAHFAEASQLLESALTIAEFLRSKRLSADVLLRQGSLFIRTRDLASAELAFSRALDAARADGDNFLQACGCAGMGKISLQLGREQDALNYFEESLSRASEIGDENLTGKMLAELACCQLKSGRIEDAERSYRLAIDIHENVGNLADLHIALSGLGTVQQFRKNYDQAVFFHTKAADLAEQLGDTFSTARWNLNLAGSFLQMGEKTKAIAANQKACSLFREVGDKRGQLASMAISVSLGVPLS